MTLSWAKAERSRDLVRSAGVDYFKSMLHELTGRGGDFVVVQSFVQATVTHF